MTDDTSPDQRRVGILDKELEGWKRKTHPYLVDIKDDERNWESAYAWCQINIPDFSHVGGRFMWQLAFKTEEQALYFKLRWG